MFTVEIDMTTETDQLFLDVKNLEFGLYPEQHLRHQDPPSCTSEEYKNIVRTLYNLVSDKANRILPGFNEMDSEEILQWINITWTFRAPSDEDYEEVTAEVLLFIPVLMVKNDKDMCLSSFCGAVNMIRSAYVKERSSISENWKFARIVTDLIKPYYDADLIKANLNV